MIIYKTVKIGNIKYELVNLDQSNPLTCNHCVFFKVGCTVNNVMSEINDDCIKYEHAIWQMTNTYLRKIKLDKINDKNKNNIL